MARIFTNRKNAAITAAVFYASALAAVLCCGCSDEYGLVDAFLKQRMVTVSFDANGGSPADINPVNIVLDNPLGWHFPDNPTRSGYRFGGWFDGSAQYTSGTKITKSVTLTAKWTEIVYGSLTDTRDGKAYKTVEIGSQTWMAENLNYETDSSWCYNSSSSNCATYGRLYSWNAAMSACPDGWHLPTSAEWNTLVSYAGGSSVAGKTLKSTSGWTSYSGITATDEFGFSALPGGYRYSDGSFRYAGSGGYWWSATEDGSVNAYDRDMFYANDYVHENNNYRSNGFSARCVAVAQD